MIACVRFSVEFYLIITVLILLSVALIIALILRRPVLVEDYYKQRIQRNIGIYKQKLEGLEAELSDAFISEDEFQRSVAENARQLIQSTEQFEKAPHHVSDHKPWFWFFVPVPLAALLIYGVIGAYPDWLIAQQMTALSTSSSEQEYNDQLKGVYESIDQRLQQRPEQMEYRIMLARAAMTAQDYDTAVSHYAILAEMLPDDAHAVAYYAQAEYMRSGRVITTRVAEYLDKALKINPFQTTALGLLGISAFEAGEFSSAIEAWGKLLQVLAPESQQAAMIQQGISEARARLDSPNSVVANTQQASDGPGIALQVTAGPALQHLNGDYAVFIYAKAASGPPMPLAVKKIMLKDLPINVSLTDAMAMMPQMRLSQFDRVIVGARVSLTGKPVASSGDWQVESEAIDWKRLHKPLSLIISDQLP